MKRGKQGRVRLTLSVLTIILIGVVVYVARYDIRDAFWLSTEANIELLMLLVPLQALMYLSAGQIYFSYLSSKGLIGDISVLRRMRLALELNFVKNIIPAGGVAGVGYMAWRLKSWGLKAGPAALAQLVRYLVILIGSIILIFIASVRLIMNGSGWLPVLLGLGLSLVAAIIIVFLAWILKSRKRVEWFSRKTHRVANTLTKTLTFGQRKRIVTAKQVDVFFLDLHQDFLQLLQNKRSLIKPLTWAIFYVIFDTATFFVAFLALGVYVDFGAVLIAQILASVVGTLLQTPAGGAGFYEATMTSFFAIIGVPLAPALAATLIARITMLLGTIVLGWSFYQHALTTGGDGIIDGKGVKLHD
ncbi:flippase-like domain-containing protein [Candidatus Saccharibacteria bacterium]|nr:flippase-like domain-containing protein [Candidatus Saccharibacteria bacterium]